MNAPIKNKSLSSLTKWQKIFLWTSLFYASQHLVRDVLSDIFNIHNAFTDFAHRKAAAGRWCHQFCRWTTFPLEIFYILASLYLLKTKKFSPLGYLMIFLLIPIFLNYFDLLTK